MSAVHALATTLSDVILFDPTVYEDKRGFFFESCNSLFAGAAREKIHFVRDNHSGSHARVLRGLHCLEEVAFKAGFLDHYRLEQIGTMPNSLCRQDLEQAFEES